MGRRRAYDTATVIRAARDVFWERGYELTSIGDLEDRTGVDRSSLYHAFGSKQALFDAALRSYLHEGIEERLRGMRPPDAGLDAVVAFFAGMAHSLRADPEGAVHGCLLVNAVGELGAHGDMNELAIGYREMFRAAFSTALGHAAARGEIDAQRAALAPTLLTAMTMGAFVSARIDSLDAATVCDGVAAEVLTWRLSSCPRKAT